MSDFDNARENSYSDRQELEENAREEAIQFHTDNWMTAVTQSVEKSHGSFEKVTDYKAVKNMSFNELLSRSYPKRPANSVDVFIEELHNLDFMERAAKILIDLRAGNFPQSATEELFASMAANYADYQYESNIKD